MADMAARQLHVLGQMKADAQQMEPAEAGESRGGHMEPLLWNASVIRQITHRLHL